MDIFDKTLKETERKNVTPMNAQDTKSVIRGEGVYI